MSEPNLQRIMLIEDDPDIRAVARMALESIGGFSIHDCSGGETALQDIVEFQPEMILLDVMMPGMDGPTTLRALQDAHGESLPPVAFMTAKVQPHEKPLYLQLGAVDVIPKPFDPMTLATTVREIWARSQSTPQT